MATSSFERGYTVSDREAAKMLQEDILSPKKVLINTRNYKNDSNKGIALLKLRLSQSETY